MNVVNGSPNAALRPGHYAYPLHQYSNQAIAALSPVKGQQFGFAWKAQGIRDLFQEKGIRASAQASFLQEHFLKANTYERKLYDYKTSYKGLHIDLSA